MSSIEKKNPAAKVDAKGPDAFSLTPEQGNIFAAPMGRSTITVVCRPGVLYGIAIKAGEHATTTVLPFVLPPHVKDIVPCVIASANANWLGRNGAPLDCYLRAPDVRRTGRRVAAAWPRVQDQRLHPWSRALRLVQGHGQVAPASTRDGRKRRPSRTTPHHTTPHNAPIRRYSARPACLATRLCLWCRQRLPDRKREASASDGNGMLARRPALSRGVRHRGRSRALRVSADATVQDDRHVRDVPTPKDPSRASRDTVMGSRPLRRALAHATLR